MKVQRPAILDTVERDLDVLEPRARRGRRLSWAAEYRVVELVDEFSSAPAQELDFRIEARNATEIAAHLASTSRPWLCRSCTPS